MDITLVVKTALGLESLCADEIRALCSAEMEVRNGEVLVVGDEALMATLNLRLRTAERVNIRLHESPCASFDDLYESAEHLPWSDLLPLDAKIIVNGSTRRSELQSIRTMQSMLKKAIVVALQRKHNIERLPESGPDFEIEFSIDGQQLSIDLNTSGSGLHRRGYRIESGEAPMRETLAAALVTLSGWDGTSPLIDPLTGSGTIPIEAAMLARNIAPGLERTFSAEKWPWIPSSLWEDSRNELRSQRDEAIEFSIYGSDRSTEVLAVAKRNAERAGILSDIRFERCLIEQLRFDVPKATVISNPPYGERMGDEDELRFLYKTLRDLIDSKPNWSIHLFSGDPAFEEQIGITPRKRRKLYNAKLKAYLFSYGVEN